MIEFIATIECFFSSVSVHKNDLQIVWARVYFSFHFSICNSKLLFIFSAPVNSRHTHKLICKSWCLLRGTKGKIILSLPPPFVLAYTLSLTMIMSQTKNHSPRINDGNTCESFIIFFVVFFLNSSSFYYSLDEKNSICNRYAQPILNFMRVFIFSSIFLRECVYRDTHARCAASNVVQ